MSHVSLHTCGSATVYTEEAVVDTKGIYRWPLWGRWLRRRWRRSQGSGGGDW